MKDRDGLTFSGPIGNGREAIHDPPAYTIPSWRSIRPSKEEFSRIAYPSFAGLAVMCVIVLSVGVGLAYLFSEDYVQGGLVICSGAVLSLAIYLYADKKEHTRANTPYGWSVNARGVAGGFLLTLAGLGLIVLGSFPGIVTLSATYLVTFGLFMVAWGLVFLAASLRE